jgi:hypothetical protein
MMKYRLPDDPKTRKAVWQTALNAVKKAQREVAIETIELNQKNISMDLEIASGKELRTEKSALRKLLFENRMKELCLIEQKKKLLHVIGDG